MRLFAFLTLLLSFSANAADLYSGGPDIEKLQIGMTAKEVVQILGKPSKDLGAEKIWNSKEAETDAVFTGDKLASLTVHFSKPVKARKTGKFTEYRIKPGRDFDRGETLLTIPAAGKSWRMTPDNMIIEFRLVKPWKK